MLGRRFKAAGMFCLLAGALACSKTQDTAPERRIFGAPPTIESAEVTNATNEVMCPWTQQAKNAILCYGVGVEPFNWPDPFPEITIRVSYDELRFNVRVTDPDTTTQTDVLLVTSSYLTNVASKPQEISLVVLDDGSSNQFEFQQKTNFYEEDCPTEPAGCNVECTRAFYDLHSNDMMAGDNMYTRGFAFVKNEGGIPSGNRVANLMADCLVSGSNQFPADTANLGGGALSFKIEAIDRSGNISEWPIPLEATLVPASFSCEGDECLCCLLTSDTPGFPAHPSDPNALRGCGGLDGFMGQFGSGYENGLCKTF